MPKRTVNLPKLNEAIRVLTSLMDEFDAEDREEMRTRADVLTTLLLATGLIARSPDDDFLNLDYALKSLGGNSRKMAQQVRKFYAVLSSYDDDAENSMEEARELLEEFGPVVLNDLTAAKEKWSNQQI
jgi:hypothetical protein